MIRLVSLTAAYVIVVGVITGAGRMGDGTQYTVNNQMVNATLMNIADSPTNVQLPGVYKNEEVSTIQNESCRHSCLQDKGG